MEIALTTVDHILTASALQWPEKTAIVDADGRSSSYKELESAANSVAELLSARGVARGSVVGMKLLNADCFLAALFGVLRARCVALPLPLNLEPPEEARVVSDSGVSWILKETPQSAQFVSSDACTVGNCCLSIASIPHAHSNNLTSLFPEAAVMRHTSGTTGESKGVVLSHSAVIERVLTSEKLFGLCSEDVVLTPLSLAYHFVASALSCIRAGATIVECADLPADQIPAVIKKHRPTLVYAAPEFYEHFGTVGSAESVRSVRCAISTSGPLRREVADLCAQSLSLRITQVFGIIEVGLPLWNDHSSYNVSSLGVCRSPYESKVVDGKGRVVSPGEVGELLLKGPGMFSGYVFTQQRTAAHDVGSWFSTGDLVEQDVSGVITFRGRKKNVIRRGNNSVYPEEVEAVLLRAPQIKTVRVIEEPDCGVDCALVAEVVLHPSAQPQEEAWRRLCSQELSKYKVPERFKIVGSLPLTASGKILRRAC